MFTRRIFILMVLAATVLNACAPKQNKKETIRKGRTANSPTGVSATGQVTSYSSGNPATRWAGLSAIDGNFQNAVYLFARPSLDGASDEDQLGFVSPQPNNTSGGIWLWGQVNAVAGGMIDAKTSRIHIEIYDSKYGQMRADGTTTTALFAHIGAEQEGFIGVEGTPNVLTFSSNLMTIMIQGNFQGDQYVGTLYFANAYTNFEYVALGRFQVPRNGFFTF